MSQIYLLVGDVQQGPYLEEEIEKMYATRQITSETLHWMEGMSEWQMIGTRNTQPGKSPTTVKTIAPPRRPSNPSQRSGADNLKKKEILSARVKPLTIGRAFILIVLTFLIFTIGLVIFGRYVPDADAEFKARVAEALKK